MKFKILFLVAIFAIASNVSFAQFDKFVLQFGAGVVNPDKGLRGDDIVRYEDNFRYQKPGDTSWYSLNSPVGFAYVNKDLFTNNMGAKTGFFLQGMGKINVDKYETVRLIGSLAFSNFNSFQGSRSGDIPVFYYDINNNYYATSKPISYDYSFNNFGLGFGVEVAPLSFTKVVSPFANAQFNFNFMSAKLTRTTGPSDSTSINFTDLRLGISLGAGIEFKVNPQWGFVLGAKYDLGNLLLKSTDQNGMIEWGRTNASINDDGGRVLSNLYGPLGSAYQTVQVKQKELNWASFYIGVNFYPNITGTKKK
jgi:hypothetical protein